MASNSKTEQVDKTWHLTLLLKPNEYLVHIITKITKTKIPHTLEAFSKTKTQHRYIYIHTEVR